MADRQPPAQKQQTDDKNQRANDILRAFAQVQAIRYNWESYWDDIARRILPHQNIFMRPTLGIPQAERRTEYIFDSTAPQALENCAALFEAMLFPRTQRWHGLTPASPSLKDNKKVRGYCEDLVDILFAARYSPRANFASQAHENTLGLTAFGTGSLFIDEAIGISLRYRAIPLQDLYFSENHAGIIDTIYRKFPFNATQAVEQWGYDKLPAAVQAAYDSPAQCYKEFEFLHVVRPRKSPEYGRKDARGMPLESCYLEVSTKTIVEEGGYRVNPYAPSRMMVGPREVYGRSFAFTNLADIKMINEMKRTLINSAQMAAEPPVLLPESGQSFTLRPGALNYGMVTDDGKILAHPFISGAQPDISEKLLESVQRSVKEGFMGNLYEMLMDHPDMTATQSLLLAQERGILLTPVMGRQQGEWLGNQIAREIDILAHAGQLPDMPDELLQAGGVLTVEYSSPLNQLQKAQDVVGISRTFEALAPYAEAGHPEVFDIFDPEATAREVAEGNGVVAKVLRSTEQFTAIQQQKQAAMNAQALVQAAPQAAAAAKDMATAASTAQNIPAAQPGTSAQ